MVTDASWTDVDHDGWMDLIVTGEWMHPTLFKNNHGKLVKIFPDHMDDKSKRMVVLDENSRYKRGWIG